METPLSIERAILRTEELSGNRRQRIFQLMTAGASDIEIAAMLPEADSKYVRLCRMAHR